MPSIADRVRETTTTEGAGTVTLLGAVLGYQSFQTAFPYGNERVYYGIVGGAQWEVGVGTYAIGSPTTQTLTRDELLDSSTGSFINFAAGTKDVFVTIPAYNLVAQRPQLPMRSGRYYTMVGLNAALDAAGTPTADTISAHPIYIPNAVTVNRIGYGIETQAVVQSRVGIYRDSGGVPGVLVAEATQQPDWNQAPYWYEVTIDADLIPGWYWLACNFGAVGGGFRFYETDASGLTELTEQLGYRSITDVGDDNPCLGVYASQALGGSLPATFPTPLHSEGNEDIPAFFIGIE